VLECGCTYDACEHDTDCTGETCACHGSPYMASLGNSCVQGNCRIDADCGANGYCSPSEDPNSCGGLLGYYCHTANDQCIDDSDCASSGVGLEVCGYSTTTNIWSCRMEGLCG
jgi:hypothetical protein